MSPGIAWATRPTPRTEPGINACAYDCVKRKLRSACTTSPPSTNHTPLRVRPVTTSVRGSSTRVYQRSVTRMPRSTPATSSAVAASTIGPSTSATAPAPASDGTRQRCRASAPKDGAPTPWPVDSAPTTAAVRRSCVSDAVVPASMSVVRRVGVPSASNASPVAGASSTSVTAGSNCASPTRTNDTRSSTALALNPYQPRLIKTSATAVGSRITS